MGGVEEWERERGGKGVGIQGGPNYHHLLALSPINISGVFCVGPVHVVWSR